MDLPTLAELAPQILVALVMVGAVVWIMRTQQRAMRDQIQDVTALAQAAVSRASEAQQQAAFNPADTGSFQAVDPACVPLKCPLPPGIEKSLQTLDLHIARFSDKLDELEKQNGQIYQVLSTYGERLAKLEEGMRWLRNGRSGTRRDSGTSTPRSG